MPSILTTNINTHELVTNVQPLQTVLSNSQSLAFLNEVVILNNTLANYLFSLLIFLLGLLFLWLLRKVLVSRLKKIALKTETHFDDFLVTLLEKHLKPLYFFGVFYLASRNLVVTVMVDSIIHYSAVILLSLVGITLVNAFVRYFLEREIKRMDQQVNRQKTVKALLPGISGLIWVIGIIFLIGNLGFDISAVITGLGIGGIAIALAAQALLGSFVSYFSIMFDRPFELGDFIIVGEYMGTVEQIGIKTTKIRSLGGEQLIFSNSDLTNSRIRNYKRMETRRIVFKIGVVYETKLEFLTQIPQIIRQIIEAIPNTRFDRSHFSAYGSYSLDFETVYYVLSGDYNAYMDIQQGINLKLYEEFERLGIAFAYPTQQVYYKENH